MSRRVKASSNNVKCFIIVLAGPTRYDATATKETRVVTLQARREVLQDVRLTFEFGEIAHREATA
jgi:hypothetical protein